MEILFIFWVAFIVKYPSYRPKGSYITFGLVAFFLALVASSIFGIDFNLSFWGDIERMLGVFHLLHFLIFYLIIITVFRKRNDWITLLSLSSVCAIFIAIDTATNKQTSYATIGNPAYVSGYLIFHIYFNLILFFQTKKFGGFRWLFLLGLPFYFWGMNRADTSGAFVGLGFSFIILFLLYGVLNKNRNIKLAAIGIFLFVSIFSSYILIINRESSIVTKSKFLTKIVREINVDKNTFQTRLISWRAAIKDYKAHPVLGTGHGNYAIIFDKYFDPKFYDETRGETYFDRAHNNVLDIMSTSGTIGIVTYLSIFLAVAFYLVQGYRKKKLDIHEFVLITCLLIAYFVQNLAVFDSLVTYMGMMLTIAMVFWLYERSDDDDIPSDEPLNNKEIYTYAIVGLIMLTVMYQYNIKVFKMLDATIAGQRVWASGNIEGTIDEYKRALAYDTVLDRDSRTSMNRLFVTNPNALSKLDKARADEILDYNIKMAERNVEYNEGDSMNQMILAQLLNIAATRNGNNSSKHSFYFNRAIEAIDKAIAASPGRIPVYFQKAQFQLSYGKKEEALETLKYTTTLSDTYYDSFCYYGRSLLFYGDEELAWPNIDKCIDLGGTKIITDKNRLKNYINHYVEVEDIERLMKVYGKLAKIDKNYETWIKYAKLLAENDRKEEARTAVESAIEINPGIEEYAREFLDSL